MSLNQLRSDVILGQECDAFFNTDVGRYVKARAEKTVMDAIAKFKETDPTDTKAIAMIQSEIMGADNALTWLNEMIIHGRNAYQQLEILADNEEY